MICSFLENSKFNTDSGECFSIKYKIKAFNIRYILQHNQPYTKLIEWFYKCTDLCTMEKEYGSIDNYEKHFEKHIVL